MEARKVQLTGGSTYTVSIPKGWAGEHGIEAGVQLHLYPHEDGSIEVRADPSGDGVRDVQAAVGARSPAAIETTLETLYAVGVGECTLEADGGFDRDQRAAIGDTVSRLLGLEIVEATDDRFVLRTFLRTADVSVRQSLDQLRLTTLSMHRNAVSAAIEGDPGRAERIAARGSEFPGGSESVVGNDGDLDSLADRARSVVANASDAVLGEPDAETAYDALAARDEVTSAIEATEREGVDAAGDPAIRWAVLEDARHTADVGGTIARIGVRAAVREDGL